MASIWFVGKGRIDIVEIISQRGYRTIGTAMEDSSQLDSISNFYMSGRVT